MGADQRLLRCKVLFAEMGRLIHGFLAGFVVSAFPNTLPPAGHPVITATPCAGREVSL